MTTFLVIEQGSRTQFSFWSLLYLKILTMILNLGKTIHIGYVARTRPLRYGHDTRMRGKFLKIHTTCVSDTTQLHDWSDRAT